MSISDLMAVVDAAIATGTIDPDKLVIGGWSYSGILTDYMIASTQRFKAASSGAGTANLLGMYGIDEYILQYDNRRRLLSPRISFAFPAKTGSGSSHRRFHL